MDSGRKHPLLAYRIRYRRPRGLYFVVALAVLALYAAIRLRPAETWLNVPWVPQLDWLWLFIGIVVLVVAILRVIASMIPYVQCSERNIKIQAPLYQVVFSYKRVRETRPNTLFHVLEKGGLSRGERKFVLDDKYGGQTAVIVEMNSWPMSMRWMRSWLGNLVTFFASLILVSWVWAIVAFFILRVKSYFTHRRSSIHPR